MLGGLGRSEARAQRAESVQVFGRSAAARQPLAFDVGQEVLEPRAGRGRGGRRAQDAVYGLDAPKDRGGHGGVQGQLARGVRLVDDRLDLGAVALRQGPGFPASVMSWTSLARAGLPPGADVYSVWTATPASRATSAIVVSAQPFLIINSRLAGIVAMALVSVLSWRRGWLLFGINSAALILVILTLTALEPLNRIADAGTPISCPPTGRRAAGGGSTCTSSVRRSPSRRSRA